MRDAAADRSHGRRVAHGLTERRASRRGSRSGPWSGSRCSRPYGTSCFAARVQFALCSNRFFNREPVVVRYHCGGQHDICQLMHDGLSVGVTSAAHLDKLDRLLCNLPCARAAWHRDASLHQVEVQEGKDRAHFWHATRSDRVCTLLPLVVVEGVGGACIV